MNAISNASLVTKPTIEYNPQMQSAKNVFSNSLPPQFGKKNADAEFDTFADAFLDMYLNPTTYLELVGGEDPVQTNSHSLVFLA